MNLRRLRFGPRARRAARRTARRGAKTAAAVALVLMVRGLAGVWAAAALVALAGFVGLIAGWAAVEARVFDRPHRRPSPPVLIPRRAPDLTAADHAAFARALTAVAAAYLTECERQEHQK